jgi:hypothetical protein
VLASFVSLETIDGGDAGFISNRLT